MYFYACGPASSSALTQFYYSNRLIVYLAKTQFYSLGSHQGIVYQYKCGDSQMFNLTFNYTKLRVLYLACPAYRFRVIANPWAIVWHYLRNPAFSHFDTIPECDRHRQTDT